MPNSMDVGDFDEDGIVDFVNFEQVDGIVRLQTYQGKGDGTFELVNEEFGLPAMSNLNTHSADVNKDGHLDVVTFSSVGNIVHLVTAMARFKNQVTASLTVLPLPIP